MVLKHTLSGDRVPICRVENLEVTLVTPDLPIRVKLPTGDRTWQSLPEIRAAEVQCMQLSLALLARHESEIYVTIEAEKNAANYLQGNDDQEQLSYKRQTAEKMKKRLDEREKSFDNQPLISKPTNAVRSEQIKAPKISKQETPQSTKPLQLLHPASDKLYRDNATRTSQEHSKPERRHIDEEEKYNLKQRLSVRKQK
jgi:hypothetical protein